MSRDHLYDKKRAIVEAAAAERDYGAAPRRLTAIAAALAGASAPTLGCLEGDDELGAFGGGRDIPQGLWEQQQWSGRATQPTAGAGTPLIRLNLPLPYARDWTIQLAAPAVPSGAAVGVPSTFAATVRMSWGHHGSTDQVLFSWPERGASLTVHGNYLELSVLDVTPAATPTANYTAWLTEGASARQSPYAFQPTFTENVGTIGIGTNTGFFPFAARTRAFYVTLVPNVNVGDVVIHLHDNLVERATIRMNLANANVNGLFNAAREPVILPPWFNGYTIENQSADVLDSVLVHQLLDLGS